MLAGFHRAAQLSAGGLIVQINTDRLELRVMELEDTVRLLTAIAGSLADILGSMHEVNKAHTRLLAGVLSRLEGANDNDEPPWENYKG